MNLVILEDIAGEVVQAIEESYTKRKEVFRMVNFPGYGRAYTEYMASLPATWQKAQTWVINTGSCRYIGSNT